MRSLAPDGDAGSLVNHARILLKADINQSQGGWTDSKIVESLDIGHATIERVRQRFVEEGLESALNRRKQQKRRRKIIDGEKEAYLIAIACSETPTGKSHWTLKMLADQGFALEGRRQEAEGRRIKPTSSFSLQDTSPVVNDGKAFGGGTSLFQTSDLLPSALVAQRLLPSFDKMVELNYVEQVSTETIRQTLKKTNLNLGSTNPG